MLTCTLRSRIVTCNVVENELWRVAIGRVKGKSLKVSNRKELNIAHVTMRCLCAVLHSPCSLHSDHAVSGSDPLRMIVGLKGFLPQRPAIYICFRVPCRHPPPWYGPPGGISTCLRDTTSVAQDCRVSLGKAKQHRQPLLANIHVQQFMLMAKRARDGKIRPHSTYKSYSFIPRGELGGRSHTGSFVAS